MTRVVSGDAGEGAISHLAVIVLIAGVVAGIGGSGIAGAVGRNVDKAVCRVAHGAGCAADRTPDRPRARSTELGPGSSRSVPPEVLGRVLKRAPSAGPAAGCDGRHLANDRRSKDEYPDSCRSPSAAENLTIMGPMRQGVEGVDPGHLPVPPRSGSGEYRSISPKAKDRAYEEALYALVAGARMKGLPHAAAYMRHFLDGTGEPVKVDPDELMGDMKDFVITVDGYYLPAIDADYCAEFSAAFAANGGRPFNKSFQGRWDLFYIEKNDSEDWYYALGGIYFSSSGYITAVPSGEPGGGPTLTMHYRVHVHDGYDWNKKAGDDGKVDIGPFKVRDEQQGRLHETGLAQDYDVDGSTEMKTRVMDCPGT